MAPEQTTYNVKFTSIFSRFSQKMIFQNQVFIIILIYLITTLTLSSNQTEFVYDDQRAISQNEELIENRWSAASFRKLWENDFWGTPLAHEYSNKSWRPLVSLFHKIQILIADFMGIRRFKFVRFISLGLHCCNFWLISNYSKNILLGLLFLVHPVTIEVAATAVGQCESLALIFGILALKYHNNQILRNILLCSGSLCKETVVSFILISILSDAKALRKKGKLDLKSLVRLIISHLPAIIFVILRLKYLVPYNPNFNKLDNPLNYQSGFEQVKSVISAWIFSVKILFLPYQLCSDWGLEKIKFLTEFIGLFSILIYQRWTLKSATTDLIKFSDEIICGVIFYLPASHLTL